MKAPVSQVKTVEINKNNLQQFTILCHSEPVAISETIISSPVVQFKIDRAIRSADFYIKKFSSSEV